MHFTFAEPSQADHVMGWTGGWGTELDAATVVVGVIDDVVESTTASVTVVTSPVEALVATVESPDPHAETTTEVTMVAIVTRMSDRIGDGRRMSS
ncbi:MAG: hypothetical protein ACKOA5_11730 [Actinomycetota bacterium]